MSMKNTMPNLLNSLKTSHKLFFVGLIFIVIALGSLLFLVSQKSTSEPLKVSDNSHIETKEVISKKETSEVCLEQVFESHVTFNDNNEETGVPSEDTQKINHVNEEISESDLDGEIEGDVKDKAHILADKIICIDPGHQEVANFEQELIAPSSDQYKIKCSGGTQGIITGVPEYELNLQVALLLRSELENNGATVVLTREEAAVNISNIERAEIANNNESHIFVRLHADGSSNAAVNGISILVPSNKFIHDEQLLIDSNRAANCILERLTDVTGAKNNGIIERGDISGFNWSNVPVVLVEMGFMTNNDEDQLLNTPEYQEKIAVGIISGLEDYFKNVEE
ncbi:N-acetylmuramoyl-L-alanine amidase family protein [Vallitalea okinawensis]|uniref:N-acetylmuramoyl-L-alanine amidase family protein n=1 Tax=Vallitalea okinawensis TaxID=2078660 RepID=UPI000CFC60E3|nr:N-acetylmuramoyl-L-alanine amidase [Vallitalea okinawensis]